MKTPMKRSRKGALAQTLAQSEEAEMMRQHQTQRSLSFLRNLVILFKHEHPRLAGALLYLMAYSVAMGGDMSLSSEYLCYISNELVKAPKEMFESFERNMKQRMRNSGKSSGIWLDIAAGLMSAIIQMRKLRAADGKNEGQKDGEDELTALFRYGDTRMPPGAELHVTGVCKALDLLVKSRDSTDPRQRSQRRIEHLKQIVGGSPAMREALSVVVEATKTASTVLILADSSSQVLTDPIARVIHFFGPRSGERFLRVNCALADDSLLESALFGHEKGAFTGARRKTDGLFREADKGTLFLDHVDEMMSTSMQIKLLHALQERRVRRVGSSQEDAVDVRIVAAFYQAPRELIAAGRFREDLYGRLNVMAVKLPTSEARFDLLADQISQLLEQARKAAACGAS